MSDFFDWDNEALETLRRLWDEGHPLPEIGRRMGVSKNSIRGKTFRLGLSRPSPIIKTGSQQTAPTPQRARGATLPALSSVAPAHQEAPAAAAPPTAPPAAREPLPPLPEVRTVAAPKPVIVAPKRQHEPQKPYSRAITCSWVTEDGPMRWKYCEAKSVSRRSYCAEHMAGLYVRVRDRREVIVADAAD